MLNKLFKAFGTGKSKPAQAVATPDISRVLRPTVQVAPPPMPPLDEDMIDDEIIEDEPMFEADPVKLQDQAEEAIDSLSDEFEGWMRGDLEKLRDAWTRAQAPGATAGDYRALYTAAHNIRGAASSYGYPSVSRLCGSLCTLLGATRPGDNSALINLHVEACRAAVAAGPHGDGSESVADAVCEALEARVFEKVAAG